MTAPSNRDKPYHHGALRQALLDAALRLTAERGIDHFTLREVARRAGVSHAAPYRHFADKRALVAALSISGWMALTDRLELVWNDYPGDGLARVVALGVAYVRFALAHPEEFRLMVRPELRRAEQTDGQAAQRPAGVQQAAHTSFEILMRGIAQGQENGVIVQGDVQGLALTAWATVHGLAVILLDGLLSADPFDERAALPLAEAVAQMLVRGLAVRERQAEP